MKKLLLLLVLTLLTACGTDNASLTAGGTCSVDGNAIVCPDGSRLELPEPAPGQDGKDGLNGTIVNIVDPCGDDPGKVDEVVMVFSDGTVLAWYLNVGFSVLQEGIVYQTTDHQRCKFMVIGGKVEDQ